MLNPRTLWQQWRQAPRFRLLRRRSNDAEQENVDIEATVTATVMTEETTATVTETTTATLPQPPPQPRLLQQPSLQQQPLISPPSPIPNESDRFLDAATTTPNMMPVIHDNDPVLYTLTPPASSPFPLVVSAKRLATDIRSKHSKRRRRRTLRDQTNTTSLMPTTMGWRQSSSSNTYDSEDEQEEWKMDTTKLSPAERTQHYWQIVYGTTTTKLQQQQEQQSSWSAQRMQPTKSCLSSLKKPRHRRSLPANNDLNSPTGLPKSFNFLHTTPLVVGSQKKITFGALSAAEFQKDEPTSSAIKPLAPEDAQQRYSVRSNTNKEEEDTAQTKNNSKILAAWGDFEDLLPRRRRRSSTIFSPSRPGQSSLLLPDTDDDDDDDDDESEDVLDRINDQALAS